MPDPTFLRALAERVEKLQAPDFALGVEVLRSLGRNIGDVNPLFSLDAAAGLVPEGWAWSVAGGAWARGPHATLLVDRKRLPTHRDILCGATTPALALTAAALRARAAEMEAGDA